MGKKSKKIVVVFCLLMCWFTMNSQTQKDSLVSIWVNTTISDSLRFKAIKDYYYNNTYAKPDTVISLTKYHYQLGKEKGVVKEMASALNERSYAHYIKGILTRPLKCSNNQLVCLKN
jgi:hypothetical protein